MTPYRVAIFTCPRSRLPDLRKYAADEGWIVVGEYIDDHPGGRALDLMIAAAHACQRDGAVMWNARQGRVEHLRNEHLLSERFPAA
jgi:hypothetical protein